MKKFLLLLAIATASIIQVNAEKITPSEHPNKCQQNLIDRGYGMFIHFGMNTFNQQEWSEGDDDVSVYNPTQLDCDQWARVARDAGFRYIILITKHHDGFCLWDSKVTDYDVASSPVTTDVVKALSDACSRYGLKFGIYYSLWDRHEPSYADEKNFGKYLKYMDTQLEELLTGYGEICEIWFDGSWDKNARDWNVPHIYDLVKKYQPDCAVGINVAVMNKMTENDRWSDDCSYPEDMVEGNDSLSLRYFPVDFRMRDPYIAHRNDKKIYTVDGKDYYLPYEQTICLGREGNWFQKSRPVEPRTVDELEELFYWATANDNALVINVPPDQRGLIRENEINTLLELRDRLGIAPERKFRKSGKVISLGAQATATSAYDNDEYGAQRAVDGGWQTRWAATDTTAQLEIALDPNKEFDRISIFEYTDMIPATGTTPQRKLNRITDYSIDIFNDGEWDSVYASSTPMGDCKVIRFPHPYKAEKVRLNITGATDCPSIYEMSVYSPALRD